MSNNKKTPSKKTPAKKTPAKKTPAKATPAKKAPAKKAPAKKSTAKGPARKKPAGPYGEAPKPQTATEPAPVVEITEEIILEKPSWISRLVTKFKK